MVCVPCFIIPLLLYIWHKFVQPILLRYWNPWEKKDAQGNVIKAGPEFPFECKGGVCPFVPGGSKEKNPPAAEDATSAAEELTATESISADGPDASDTPKQTSIISGISAESKKLN
ncbi:UPF0729 protein GD16342 [Drosophila virilis]|uniref:Uncharacterized protein n=1 Tax=Drosophila virilis TaxID=7244 RepID=B4MCT3_DROVI|nr:UPF0729 protein GD16342 [Drosophila virilis]EDW58005.1 uncharacterized protein Dvir_GJ15269 [Drosophila virilis]